MSNRIPTTDEVRDAAMNSSNWEEQILPAEFDRWLAEVKAEAWEEGYSTGLVEKADKVTFNPYGYAQHPYRQGEEQ